MGSHYGTGGQFTIPPEAFEDPLNPTEEEIQEWVEENVPPSKRHNSYIIYEVGGVKHIWKTFRNPDGLLELTQAFDYLIVNNDPLADEPSTTGNTTNLNSVVISDKGQHWIVDKNGNAVNLNKSEGSYEVTNETEGFIYTDVLGNRWIIRVTTDGSINTEKL